VEEFFIFSNEKKCKGKKEMTYFDLFGCCLRLLWIRKKKREERRKMAEVFIHENLNRRWA